MNIKPNLNTLFSGIFVALSGESVALGGVFVAFLAQSPLLGQGGNACITHYNAYKAMLFSY